MIDDKGIEKDKIMPFAFEMLENMGMVTNFNINTAIVRLKMPEYARSTEFFINQKEYKIECFYYINIPPSKKEAKKVKDEANKYAKKVLSEYFWNYEILIRIRAKKKNGKEEK